VKKTGSASVKSLKSISATAPSIRTPTITRAGAVASAGTIPINPPKKRDTINKIPTTIFVSPVLPPSAIPAADSQP
jgi:hypothetical protein